MQHMPRRKLVKITTTKPMGNKQYQIRFRDIDPDTGFVSQDKLIAFCETMSSANWVIYGLHLTMQEDNDPNREIYMLDSEQ